MKGGGRSKLRVNLERERRGKLWSSPQTGVGKADGAPMGSSSGDGRGGCGDGPRELPGIVQQLPRLRGRTPGLPRGGDEPHGIDPSPAPVDRGGPRAPPPASDNLRHVRTWLSRGRTARPPRRADQPRRPRHDREPGPADRERLSPRSGVSPCDHEVVPERWRTVDQPGASTATEETAHGVDAPAGDVLAKHPDWQAGRRVWERGRHGPARGL